MIKLLLVSLALICATVMIHGVGTFQSIRRIARLWSRKSRDVRPWRAEVLIIQLVSFLLLLHIVEISIWAAFYYFSRELPDYRTAVYYSLTSYTTVGYGDVVLTGPWRLVGPIEALVGVLMMGWSTGVIVTAILKTYTQRLPPELFGLTKNSNPTNLLQVALPLVLCMALLPGCTVGPDYVPPEVVLPDAWHQPLTEGLTAGQADFQTWWLQLNDPVLNRLLEEAVGGNLDLKTAAARIRQARAQLGIATGRYWPEVDGVGFYSRQRPSENGTLAPFLTDADEYSLYSAGIDAFWELDVFGRIDRAVESSEAFLEASIENYRDVLVILYADAALNYIEVRSLQARIQYALENIQIQQETLELTQDRYEAGLAPELDVHQARLNLADTESLVPDLRAQQVQALNRLDTLLGRPPGELEAELVKAGPIPPAPEDLVVGLPAELLRQRPDIRRAERLLAAQTAEIGVATADLYPTFSLFGTFALEARQFDDLGNWGSRTWSLGPEFVWNLFRGGRIRSNIRLEEGRTEEAFWQYQQTILLALEEVEDALVAYKEERIRMEALARSEEAAQKSVELVNDLYREGLTNFQNVLDTQRSLTRQQDQLAQSRGLVTQNLVRIYRALGGGWTVEGLQPPPNGVTEINYETK